MERVRFLERLGVLAEPETLEPGAPEPGAGVAIEPAPRRLDPLIEFDQRGLEEPDLAGERRGGSGVRLRAAGPVEHPLAPDRPGLTHHRPECLGHQGVHLGAPRSGTERGAGQQERQHVDPAEGSPSLDHERRAPDQRPALLDRHEARRHAGQDRRHRAHELGPVARHGVGIGRDQALPAGGRGFETADDRPAHGAQRTRTTRATPERPAASARTKYSPGLTSWPRLSRPSQTTWPLAPMANRLRTLPDRSNTSPL